MKEKSLCINSLSTNALLVYSRDVDTGSDFLYFFFYLIFPQKSLFFFKHCILALLFNVLLNKEFCLAFLCAATLDQQNKTE